MGFNTFSYCGVKAPCKDCTKRFLGCHGSCMDYENYLQDFRKAKAKEQEKINRRILRYSKHGSHVSSILKRGG